LKKLEKARDSLNAMNTAEYIHSKLRDYKVPESNRNTYALNIFKSQLVDGNSAGMMLKTLNLLSEKKFGFGDAGQNKNADSSKEVGRVLDMNKSQKIVAAK